MTAGPELAEAASQALGAPLKFHSVREAEAKKILQGPQGKELDDSEKAYLLEFVTVPCSLSLFLLRTRRLTAWAPPPHAGTTRSCARARPTTSPGGRLSAP